MGTISFTAVFLGVLTGIVASAIAGLIFGIGFAIDTANEIEQNGKDPLGEEADKLFDQAFGDAAQQKGFGIQLIVISIATAILSGAVTAWLAPAAPLSNAALVGAIGTAISLASVPMVKGISRSISIAGSLVTLPATLAGAWLMI